jgi:ABC-type transport system involved in multi-copper enzyme maturation permease subunit
VKNWKRSSIVSIITGIIFFIVISFIVQEHTPVLAQSPPTGPNTNKLSGIIPMTNSIISSYSNTGKTNSTENPTGVMYTAKFECGSIFAGEGPLRPGHYDTDVSIFNKDRSESTMFWNVVVNNGPSSNAVLVNLGSENATSITCLDIRKVLDNYNENFVEGFIIINVPFNSILQPSKGTIISSSNYDNDPLEVQVFYTANALDTLPHEIIVDKILFYIIQDGTGKIPSNMIRQPLDISMLSTLNQLSNTEDKVKEILAKQYNLTSDDLPKVVVRIASINVGVGALIDDHAISLSAVRPQLVP